MIGANAVIGPDVRIGRNCGDRAECLGRSRPHRRPRDPACRLSDRPGRVWLCDGTARASQDSADRPGDHSGRRGDWRRHAPIDRGGLRDTVIGEGTKIDNQVQVGHNVVIGRHCVLVAQVAIAGGVVLEDFVMLGGQVGVADGLTIGEGAKVAAQSGVMSNIPPGQSLDSATRPSGSRNARAEPSDE